MISTNFVTPSGLDDECHYTTATDMAFLASEAISNSEFEKIASSKQMSITYNSKANGEITANLSNHNKLLSYLDDCIGVKTGYTKKSGRCLVSAVKRDGIVLICVTLNAPDDWNDHISLYERSYADLKTYNPVTIGVLVPSVYGDIVELEIENKSEIKYFSDKEIKEKIYLPRFIYYNGDKPYGRIDYIQGNEVICSKLIVGR